MLKLRTLFSGIGSPEAALRNLNIPFELVDFCEIDKYAIQSYCAIHNVDPSKNLGDISKVSGKNLPYADLLVWGFPCQSISIGGKMEGIIEGQTRSGLYYEGLRILRETKPKYSIIENVKNLTSKRFKGEFEQMLSDIEGLGYHNYWKVLNSRDFFIPQNRERVFIVSIRDDIDDGTFEFPQGYDSGLRLKDFLEDEVAENFYVSQDRVDKLILQLKDNPYMNKNRDFDPKLYKATYPLNSQEFARVGFVDDCPTLAARDYKDPKQVVVMVKVANETGYDLATVGDTINIQRPTSDTRRGRVGHGVAQTIETTCHQTVLVPNRLGGLFDTESEKHQAGAVWDANYLCPTLDTMQGGYRQPSVLVNGCSLRTRNYRGQEQKLEVRKDEVSNTITSVEKDSMILEDFYQNREPRTYEDYSPTLRAERSGLKVVENYRIRRLTPLECFLLMGFSREDHKRAVDAGVSNSQLYKQCGNSIVTTVLSAIFKNLLYKEV